MSSVGLNSNVYRLTGKYLRLLNDFIAKSNTFHNSDTTDDNSEVIAFFAKLQNEESVDPNFQLLTSIVERKLRSKNFKSSIFFTNLLNDIKSNNFKEAYTSIELVIEALDNEHFSALSVIKGA